MIVGHRHASGIGLTITTHTTGQRFGTFARVHINGASGPVIHETETFGYGHEEGAIRAARAWIDRRRALSKSIVA